MYLSLRRHLKERASFYLYCYDWESCFILQALALPRVTIIHISEVEQWCRICKDHFIERTLVEYMFTMTPFVIRHAYSLDSASRVIYVDSDYYFYSSPLQLLSETEEYDLSFVEHGFPPKYQYLSVHGTYNVGWNSFARTRAAKQALNQWCILTAEWCFDKIENGRYADQKYLDILASSGANFITVSSNVMGLAEYNFFQYDIKFMEGSKHGTVPKIFADNQTVISWHHHGVIENENGEFSLRINIDEARTSLLYHQVYSYYIGELQRLDRALIKLGLGPGYGNMRSL